MALPSSGTLSLNEIHVEAGGSSGSLASINDSDIRGLIGKSSGAAMSFSEWYGATANVDLPIPGSGTNINGQSQYQQITVSDYISSGGQLTIPSSLWIWSDDTSIAALTIDIPCTIVNNGKIIGKGGAGGGTTNVSTTNPSAADNAGNPGGPAIKINSSVSGVTITNASGAYIAGGGGGGAGGSSGYYHNGSDYYLKAGGGGGAGGGAGQSSYRKNGDVFYAGGAGGILNAAGGNGGASGGTGGTGGGSGGGGGFSASANANFGRAGGGGGGGRILPGTGGAGGTDGAVSGGVGSGGAGGDADSAGSNNGNAGGGGGWGAAGGTSTRVQVHNPYSSTTVSGGAAGKAVEDSGNSYTLNNSGTIYGATT